MYNDVSFLDLICNFVKRKKEKKKKEKKKEEKRKGLKPSQSQVPA
jgi:hypothetical protein